MKYIRTKDNRIYEVVEEYNTTYLVKAHKNYRNIKKAIDGTRIVYKASCINQADTIEELCDEFVVIGMKENHIERSIYSEFDKELFTNLKCKANGFAIYGAIWTEWGLKYVAKMNSEGELELL